MDPRREAEIRAALAAGRIPEEYEGDIVDGDWQDFAAELRDEVDRLRLEAQRSHAPVLSATLKEAAHATAHASHTHSTFSNTPADVHQHLGELLGTVSAITDLIDQLKSSLLDWDDDGLLQDSAEPDPDPQADPKAIIVLREAHETACDLIPGRGSLERQPRPGGQGKRRAARSLVNTSGYVG